MYMTYSTGNLGAVAGVTFKISFLKVVSSQNGTPVPRGTGSN
jgi:hypothetical protein